MHSCGNTPIKGWSWPNSWASSVTFSLVRRPDPAAPPPSPPPPLQALGTAGERLAAARGDDAPTAAAAAAAAARCAPDARNQTNKIVWWTGSAVLIRSVTFGLHFLHGRAATTAEPERGRRGGQVPAPARDSARGPGEPAVRAGLGGVATLCDRSPTWFTACGTPASVGCATGFTARSVPPFSETTVRGRAPGSSPCTPTRTPSPTRRRTARARPAVGAGQAVLHTPAPYARFHPRLPA
jgi:hypothetical protein